MTTKRIFLLFLTLFAAGVKLSAGNALTVTTDSETGYSLALLKYDGFELDTLEKFTVSSMAPFKKSIRDIGKGIFVISLRSGVQRMFLVTGTEDVAVQIARPLGFDEFSVTSFESGMLDSLFNTYNGKMQLADQIGGQIAQTPRSNRRYRSLTDSLTILKEKALIRANAAVDELCKRHPKSVALSKFRPLFTHAVRYDMDPSFSMFETDESFQLEHFWDNLKDPNDFMIQHPYYYSRVDEYFMRYAEKTNDGLLEAADKIVATVEDNPEAREYIIRYILRLFERNTPEDFYLIASDKYLSSCSNEEGFTDEIERAERIKKLQIGAPAPDFAISKLGGEKITLSSLKGKPVILLFWASWCPHCMEELPEIKKQYDTLREKGVQILAVSLDEDAASWTGTINTSGTSDWIHACEFKKWKSEAAVTYNIHRTPTLYIIDEMGNIKAKDAMAKSLISYF